MTIYRAQVTFPGGSGDTSDIHVNTFHIESSNPDLTVGEAELWRDALQDMYESIAVTQAMKGYSTSLGVVKIYDVATPPPNYPLFDLNVDTGEPKGTVVMPPEVALCISYANDSEVAVPRGRRRGRIYIGGVSNPGGQGRPSESGIMQTCITAFTGYVNSIYGGLGSPVVWSPTAGQGFPIERIWVDNEYDTQRRRGGKPTSRLTSVYNGT